MKHRVHAPENKILLCLQYWRGDKKQAMDLARFICDLQPGRCDIADFLFISRYDCSHDQTAIKYVSKKFNVWQYTSRRRGTGWPIGPNELWFGSMEWFASMKEARKIPNYKAIFTFEADCVPLASNWINRLSQAWDDESAKHPTFVLGAYLTAPGPHVNGNMMLSGHPAFLHWLTKQVGGVSVNAGWDFVLYRDFAKWGAYNFPNLKSYWGCKTFPEDAFLNELAQGTVFLHGIKDGSLLHMARKKLLG